MATSLTCHQNISCPTSMQPVTVASSLVVFLMLDSQVFEIMDCLSMRHRIMKRSGTLELLTFSIFAEGQTKEFCLYGDFIEKEICFTQFTCRCAFNCKLHLCLEYAGYFNGTSSINYLSGYVYSYTIQDNFEGQ